MATPHILPVVVVVVFYLGGCLSMNYPLFYLTPSSVPSELAERMAFVPRPLEKDSPPLVTNRIELALDPSQEGEQYQVSQFHTQDAKGRFFFGFRSPDQVRLETRNQDGTIKGSYSYIDPYGQLIKMQYWDDGDGFHTSGNNLPVMYYDRPQFTPEVQAAREEHFRLYKQALEAALAAGDGDNHDVGDYPEQDSSSQEKDFKEEMEEEDDLPIPETEEEEDDVIDLENYPKVQFPPGLISPNHVFDDETEAVYIENPELSFKNAVLTRFWQRRGKSMEDVKPVHEHVEEAPLPMLKRPSLAPTVQPGSNMRSQVTNVNKRGSSVDGFYYHFQHYIPVQVLAHDDMTEGESNVERQSVSALAKETGAVPVAAVHDAQVSPLQKGVFPQQLIFLQPIATLPKGAMLVKEQHDAQVSPLQKISGTGLSQDIPILTKEAQETLPVEKHDAQVSPLQKSAVAQEPQTLSALLKEAGPRPAVEVHDTQVSPQQRSSQPDQDPELNPAEEAVLVIEA